MVPIKNFLDDEYEQLRDCESEDSDTENEQPSIISVNDFEQSPSTASNRSLEFKNISEQVKSNDISPTNSQHSIGDLAALIAGD